MKGEGQGGDAIAYCNPFSFLMGEEDDGDDDDFSVDLEREHFRPVICQMPWDNMPSSLVLLVLKACTKMPWLDACISIETKNSVTEIAM